MRATLNKNQQLKKLTSEWYKRLKDHGFKDIETVVGGREYLKDWSASYFQDRYDPLTFHAKHDYYYLAHQFLHSHRFRSQIEREIWALHTEGWGYREIAMRILGRMDVALLRVTYNKDIINAVVLKLKGTMMRNLEQRQGIDEFS